MVHRLRLAWLGVALIVLTGIGARPAAAEIYKWTDEQGRVHFTDRPPDKRSATVVQVRINSYDGPATVSALRELDLSAAQRVVMYGTQSCGYCKLARAFLRERGTPYREIDVDASEQGRRDYQRLGGRGVPVILVGRQRMDGYSREGLEQMLRGAGL